MQCTNVEWPLEVMQWRNICLPWSQSLALTQQLWMFMMVLQKLYNHFYLCIYLVYFCFPEPWGLLSGEEYLNCHLLSPPLGQPDLTIPVKLVSHNTLHLKLKVMYQIYCIPWCINMTAYLPWPIFDDMDTCFAMVLWTSRGKPVPLPLLWNYIFVNYFLIFNCILKWNDYHLKLSIFHTCSIKSWMVPETPKPASVCWALLYKYCCLSSSWN